VSRLARVIYAWPCDASPHSMTQLSPLFCPLLVLGFSAPKLGPFISSRSSAQDCHHSLISNLPSSCRGLFLPRFRRAAAAVWPDLFPRLPRHTISLLIAIAVGRPSAFVCNFSAPPPRPRDSLFRGLKDFSLMILLGTWHPLLAVQVFNWGPFFFRLFDRPRPSFSVAS